MNESLPEVKPKTNKEPLKHLKEGEKDIVACVGTPEHFKYDGKMNWILSGKDINYACNVDYRADPTILRQEGFLNDGKDSYVISPVDILDKYSRDYYNCTGLIIAGKEKRTGKNISFMSHQDPNYFLAKRKSKFSSDLIRQIQEIKDRCEEGTVDAIIFGGKYLKTKTYAKSDPTRDVYIEEYLKSIRFVSEKVEQMLGFEPLIITGPKTVTGETETFFYDTLNRRLFLVRKQILKDKPEKEHSFDAIKSFTLSELEEVRKNWKPEETGLPV